MNITVLDELRVYIDPLTPDEYAALERSILAEGCRDALVLWGEVLVDGHNRYSICSKHGLPFQTMQNTRFQSMEDVHLWMIDQHLGRRSVSDFQRGVLALRKKEILDKRPKPLPSTLPPAEAAAEGVPGAPEPEARLVSRESIAKAARISSATVAQIEKIQKAAAPELVEAVKTGTVSISAAATIAALPAEEQQAAVAGGKKELREAAKRVRESKGSSGRSKKGAEAETDSPAEAPSTGPGAMVDVSDPTVLLQMQVEALQDENARLKQQVAELQTQLLAARAG
ncbi:plasmid replication/partition related protein [Roseateles sp. DAIF2]|uniref:plasmid replication/partition related protein n=1 Tax=Roseateles sp. DAIF2 TaxID=2714952 RepID=UPI0018A2D3A0|nr:plasmid replication/partition related protein [Roseateles sp. DAIF2]QPF72931.1 plasmid replication/partition related protein [Roseateles sp. DAIF2]